LVDFGVSDADFGIAADWTSVAVGVFLTDTVLETQAGITPKIHKQNIRENNIIFILKYKSMFPFFQKAIFLIYVFLNIRDNSY